MLVFVPSAIWFENTCDIAIAHYALNQARVAVVPEAAGATDNASIFLNPLVPVAVAVIVFVPAETPTASELTVS
tara:strand:- start:478 stop:699 length:222 start_codon:yes stop_codon:yes gene_type:complete